MTAHLQEASKWRLAARRRPSARRPSERGLAAVAKALGRGTARSYPWAWSVVTVRSPAARTRADTLRRGLLLSIVAGAGLVTCRTGPVAEPQRAASTVTAPTPAITASTTPADAALLQDAGARVEHARDEAPRAVSDGKLHGAGRHRQHTSGLRARRGLPRRLPGPTARQDPVPSERIRGNQSVPMPVRRTRACSFARARAALAHGLAGHLALALATSHGSTLAEPRR
jgi:hypothetical protein